MRVTRAPVSLTVMRLGYILIGIAIAGSLLAILSGQGNENLGPWSIRGPWGKGTLFEYALIVFLVLIAAPLINYILKLKKSSDEKKIEKEFFEHFKDGRAKRYKPT